MHYSISPRLLWIPLTVKKPDSRQSVEQANSFGNNSLILHTRTAAPSLQPDANSIQGKHETLTLCRLGALQQCTPATIRMPRNPG